MKTGDIVRRRLPPPGWKNQHAIMQLHRLGFGLVLSRHMSGKPSHPCVSVYYPKTGKVYDIAVSLMEVVSESR